jgi:hypothetical protein
MSIRKCYNNGAILVALYRNASDFAVEASNALAYFRFYSINLRACIVHLHPSLISTRKHYNSGDHLEALFNHAPIFTVEVSNTLAYFRLYNISHRAYSIHCVILAP